MNGFLGGDAGEEVHLEGLESYFGIRYCEEELPGEEGAAGLGRVAVEDQWRGFHIHDEFCRFGGGDFGTAFCAATGGRIGAARESHP